MEQGTSDGSENSSQKVILNGSVDMVDDELSIPPLSNKEALPLDEGAAELQGDAGNPPIRAVVKEGHPLPPNLSNQSSCSVKDSLTLQNCVDSVLTVSNSLRQETQDLNPDSLKTLPRTAEKSNCPENQCTPSSVPMDKPSESASNVVQSNAQAKSSTNPFQVNPPHSAIESTSEPARVVDASLTPKEQPRNKVTPTTSSPPQPPTSHSEGVGGTGETEVDIEKLVDETRTEVAQSSVLSTSTNSAFGDAQSVQSDTTSNSRATSPQNPSTCSSDSLRPSAMGQASSSKPAPSSQKTSSKLRGNAMIFVPDLSEELMQGYRILTEIFGDNCKSFVWPFLDPVDTETLWDYENRIKHPMWLRKIESKFVSKEYQSITEFAVDMRQMLENCYRYNGMKHQISKYAQRLECVFEQKLALLSRPLQEKTTLYVTSDGKYSDGCPSKVELSSGRLRRACTRLASRALEQAAAAPLAFHIKQELEQQEREEKRQKIVDRRDEIIKERQDLLEWDKQLIGEPHWTYMESLWEIPAIGHFLCLCQPVLEFDEISFFELERSFAIPMESMILRRIFTTLLSTPYQRTRLGKKPPMPYKVWEARLREWVRGWYVVLDKLGEPTKVYEKIGVPERFFEVLGPYFPLDKLQYHELTYYERVWIMKALCDQLFETQLTVRRCLLSQPVEEQRPIVLGVDGEDNSYVHFPQFCGADLRIYRQSKFPDLLKKSRKDKVKTEETEDLSGGRCTPQPRKYRKGPAGRKRNTKSKPVVMETPRARPSRLRQRLTPTLHYGTYAESVVSSTESEDVTSEFTEVEDEPESDSQSECQATSVDRSESQADSNRQLECHETSSSQSESQQALTGQSEGLTISDSQSRSQGTSNEPSEDVQPMEGIEEGDIEDSTKDLQTGVEKHQPTPNSGEVKQEQTNKPLVAQDDNQTAVPKPSPTEQLCNGEATPSHSSTTSENTPLEDHPKPCTEQESKDGISKDNEKCQSTSSDNGLSNPGSDFKAIAECSIETEGEPEANATSEGMTVAVEQNTNNNSSHILDRDQEMKPLMEPLDKPCDDANPAAGDDTAPPASPPVPHKEVLPTLGEFELVCDSMESLRELVDKFGPPEAKPPPPTTGRKRKVPAYVKQPVRKRCEKELHEKLTNLLLELTPYEAKLAKFAMRNRERFKKEYEAAKMTPETEQDIKDIWASEESSSESECEAEPESEEEGQPVDDNDEDWDAGTEGMRLRKRTVKKPASEAQDDDEEAGETVQEDAPKKPKRPRLSGRRSPPHKNQLNTSLMGLLKSLSNDGLKDVCKRLQTMIKRAEVSRNHVLQKSKIDPASVSGCGDEQAVMAFLNKSFWFGAKPPAVEGKVAETIKELISTYPMFVHNLIFRNLKNGLSKLAKAAKSTSPDSVDQKSEPGSKENSAVQSEPKEEPFIDSEPSQETMEGENVSELTSSNRMETRSSLSNNSQENMHLESKTKTKEVMDDFTLAGLYTVLSQTRAMLRERLATGLSELLPDYLNLQESIVKTDPQVKKEQGIAVQQSLPSSRSERDKELLLNMLPKPSQYLKGPKIAAEGSTHVSQVKYLSNADVGSIGNTMKQGNSLIVPVPTAKLPFVPKNWSQPETDKATISAAKPPQAIAQAVATTGNPQTSENSGAVPHGVYTIKVDASVWTQLQGKPELQQQFVLQQIKEMQRKQSEAGSAGTSAGSLNNPAQAVTCIRSPPRTQASLQKTSSPTKSPVAGPARNTGRISKTTNLQNIPDLSSLQPIKLSKPARPRASAKNRGLPESASNLSQKELIALLQQQQRQLELYRQQQQKPRNDPQQQQQQTQQQQPAKQQFVLSASGALLLSPQSQKLTASVAPNTPIVVGVRNASPQLVPSCVAPLSQNSASTPVQAIPAPSLAVPPTRLSTKTTVTAAVKQPKMTTNLINSKPGAVASYATSTIISQSGQQPRNALQATVPPNPSLTSNTAPAPRLHLVQANNGTQFVVRTGSIQAPRLAGPSAGMIGKPGNAVPVVLTGQNNQASAMVVSSASNAALAKALSQTVQFVMQPSLAVTDTVSVSTAKYQPQGVQGSSQLLGKTIAIVRPQGLPQAGLLEASQLGSQANQVALRRETTTKTNQSVGQVAESPRQTSLAVAQKPQLAVVKGLGDSKVIIGSPTKVVSLVHPSHLSTAATFVPKSDPGQARNLAVVVTKGVQVAQQGLQVLSQTQGQQQLVRLPVQPAKMESVPLATSTQGPPSVSGTIIQEHLQQVVLQQLAAGKLKLTPQTIPVSQIIKQVNQQQASNQQLKAGQLSNSIPVVLSQQAPQLIAQPQPSVPATIKTCPPIARTDAAFDQQLPSSIQVLNQTKSGQGPMVGLVAASQMTNQGNASQEIQGRHLVSSVSGSGSSNIQVPAVQNSPAPMVVQAPHLVLAPPSLNNQTIYQPVPAQVILQTASQPLPSPSISLQTGVKRTAVAPVLEPVAKVPRVTAPVQTTSIPTTTVSGFAPNTTKGVS